MDMKNAMLSVLRKAHINRQARFFYDLFRKYSGIDERQKRDLPLILEAEQERLFSLPVREVNKHRGESLNVAQVNTFDKIGGAALVAWRLHNAYKEKGHNAAMLVSRKFSEDNSVIGIGNNRRDDLFRHICFTEGWQYWNYLSTFDIPQIEQFENADIVHFHNLHGDYFNYFALPGLTRLKPSIWTLHDMQSFTGHCAHSLDCEKWQTGCGDCGMLDAYPALEKDTSSMIWRKKKEIFSMSDVDIVVPSRWLLDIVKKSMLSDKDIRLIYNGVDTQIFRPFPREEMRKRFNIPADKTVFITSAAFAEKNPYKGREYLLDALGRFKSENGIYIVSIGDKAHDPGIKGVNWISTGHIFSETEIAKWYSAADMLLFPSIAENCPLAIIEAMACGLPVVAFKTGGIPELVSHMETGYVAEYKKVEDFLKGIELFAHDKELREKAGRLGRAKVEKNFTLETMANSYIELYYEVIDKRSQKSLKLQSETAV